MLKKLPCLFPFFILLSVVCSCSKTLVLSDLEKKFLKKNDSITVAIYPYYPPYQFINEQNEADGVFIEYLEIIEKKINYKFKRKQYKDWPKLIQDVKENKINLILEIQKTENRKSYLKFQPPLFESQQVIVTRKDVTFGNNIKNLHDKTIVLPKNYGITETLNSKYPDFTIVTRKDELECLVKLNSGEYDAYIGPRAVANYFIRSKKLDNLKINSDTNFNYEPSIAINKNDAILDDIISKVLTSITREEKESIINNWLYQNVTPFYQTSKFWIIISLISIFAFLLGAFLNYYLKFKIRQKTEELIIAKDIAEESNRLKTNFINNIPQEIRTPMNGIIGLSEFLNEENLSQEERKKYTQMIIGNSKELLSIIDNILEISQLQTKRFTLRLVEVNLQDVFQTLASNYKVKAEEKDIKFYIENNLKNSENMVFMDRTKLNKILNAIVDNAVKYTSNGSVTISCIVKYDFLHISIEDTGIGISEKNKDKIQESLASNTKNTVGEYNGIGLGLTIAKKNADFIGCQISVLSDKNKGTTFILKAPYNTVSKNKTDKVISQDKQLSKTEKHIILIAEDGETNFLFLKTILTKMNEYDFTIYRAKNGQEAVTICQENNNIDLVLMDIKMPIMDGYDATSYIKKIRPNLPVIAQTAYSIEEDVQKALDAGCDDFVSKPVDRKVLKPMLNKYFPILKRNKNKITNSK
ncbi:transporter substrate-binding domain-containing protein [uncultured Aquimarina sp.]|uniref:response regulator n=1 Tax=uncultured Aquimarina sp. TaxID=575652 RepID=UPI002634A36D|nr:transporter substrate-binding domain-containing protein [uncultured Aquimarina sp.]